MARMTEKGKTLGTGASRIDEGTGKAAKVIVRNKHATVSLLLGGPAVTPSTGFEVLAGETFTDEFDPTRDPLFGCAASGTITVDIMTLD